MSSVVFTSYFSKKKHPNSPQDTHVIGRQENGHVLNNSIEYIKPWYYSMKELNIEGRVFYDDLSDEFIEKYQTEKIKFVKVETSSYSNNDWRFFCYFSYLQSNKFDSVFLTDGSDVIISNDPSEIIEKFPETDLFVCKDSIKLNQFPYLQIHKQVNWNDTIYFMLNESNLDLINMGVIGGSYQNILEFLQKFIVTRINLGNPDFNSDMWIGQYVFRSLLKNKSLMIGEPFTSEFKKYQIDRKDVYFIHK